MAQSPQTQSLQNTLVALDERLWTGGAEAYRAILGDQCLLALSQMTSVMSHADVVKTVEHGPRWNKPDLKVRGLIQPSDDVAILSYEARATRGEGESYHALVSSGYRRIGDDWKLMFHQQTPLD